jgi:F-type H+-transporting ATPase subunit a
VTLHLLGALQFPAIGELVDWKKFGFGGLNKTGLLMVLAAVIVLVFFLVAGRKKALVPTGAQNLGEMVFEFITDSIIMQTMGEDGMVFLPYLTTLFMFILVCNLFEIIPVLQFPPMARMAMPAALALVTYVMFNFMGIKKQGLGHYMKNSLFPPGVPKALYFLVTPIEFISTFLVRPFSLAVRLFANELAGHLLLVTFAVLTDTLLFHNSITLFKPIAILPAAMDVGLTGFELLVAVLQAFIFTILTAVYLGLAMQPEH